MGLMLGELAPDFTAQTTVGAIRFYDWLGPSWGMLFSHPADHTPVCTTELGQLAKLQPEFDRRDVKLLGLSVDSLRTHQEWIREINASLHVKINYPLIADEDRHIADRYGMLGGLEEVAGSPNATVRSVFIVDPRKIIRMTMCYPDSTGRNFDEILRVIDALQITYKHGLSTPANWRRGDDCLIPTEVTDGELNRRYPNGWMQVTPYLRYTPCPRMS